MERAAAQSPVMTEDNAEACAAARAAIAKALP